MPFNDSGIFNLDHSNPVQADTVIDPDWANPTLADIADGLTRTLVRDGRAPMTGPLVLFGDAAAPLVATPLRQVEALIASVQAAAIAAVYPIGSVYINNINAANPLSILGFGTWVSLAGRVLVGYASGDPVFGTAGATGGSKDTVAVSHSHTGSAAVAGGHTPTGSTATDPGHTHGTSMSQAGGMSSGCYGGGAQSGGDFACGTIATTSAGSHSHTLTMNAVADHTHTITVNAAGVSGANANLQPYLVAYMWERTA
jgi:hypothetical protein